VRPAILSLRVGRRLVLAPDALARAGCRAERPGRVPQQLPLAVSRTYFADLSGRRVAEELGCSPLAGVAGGMPLLLAGQTACGIAIAVVGATAIRR
jgi:hypothetical protein